jgi:hypothetical protein
MRNAKWIFNVPDGDEEDDGEGQPEKPTKPGGGGN